ncbi:dTDP-L-rhamnose 4-epimerase-like [Penaeus monodon]|uniref:dTDP-L-rhamnose 4-epimerase-like n=1 Tax=Penaeus monodon TaxID=6687 RepID=UPI0018A7B1F6|nr:dTDP-L-rhamnose 4-epimerase-like [Penaeus monodon]
MSKSVLITGGAGFIGSNLALALVAKGYSISILDNLSPQIHGDPDSSELYQSIKDKVHFIEGIMLDLLANTKHQVQKVVVASSRAIYGEGKYWSPKADQAVYPEGRTVEDLQKGIFEPKCPITKGPLNLMPTCEESKIHPNSIYGLTKYNQEQAVLIACKAIGINAVAFRYQNVYGPGQSLKNPYTGILSIFSTRIKNGKDINIFEDGLESRDFVYIDDVINATILGIENEGSIHDVSM